MSRLARKPPRSGGGVGERRPVGMGWSIALVFLAVASIAVAVGASSRGVDVHVPPIIDIGTGVGAARSSPSTAGAEDPSSPVIGTPEPPVSPVDPAPATTVPARTSESTLAHAAPASPPSRPSNSSQPVSGRDGEQEGGDSPTTVAPNYPVVGGSPTSGGTSGESDS